MTEVLIEGRGRYTVDGAKVSGGELGAAAAALQMLGFADADYDDGAPLIATHIARAAGSPVTLTDELVGKLLAKHRATSAPVPAPEVPATEDPTIDLVGGPGPDGGPGGDEGEDGPGGGEEPPPSWGI